MDILHVVFVFFLASLIGVTTGNLENSTAVENEIISSADASLIGVTTGNLENSTAVENEIISSADDRCVEKCGKDPSIKCVEDLKSDDKINCSCKDEFEIYDKKSQQCLDRCAMKCGYDSGIKCEGDQKTDDTTVCSCKNETLFYNPNLQTCGGRCARKCGEDFDTICKGNQTNDETTICGCTRDILVYKPDYRRCVYRCHEVCGDVVWCLGDQTSDETTICSCLVDTSAYDKTIKRCKSRCSMKCGNSPFVKCKGDLKTDETTICSCTRENRVFDEESLTCIKRCGKKCGWDSSIKCEGDQMTDETTMCGCKDPTHTYDQKSQTCKIKCYCENGICEEDENGTAICSCLPEYGLVSNLRCEECGCGIGANCTFEGSLTKCICREGYSEVSGTCKGDCSKSPCKNGGTCRTVAEDIACDCVQPFSGEFCEKTDRCISNPCKNGGTCRNKEDNFECTCTETYGGKDCSENIWCDVHGQDLCGKEKCQYNEDFLRGYCICENNKVFYEPSKTCIDPHCASDPCRNGGTCIDEIDTYECICPQYYAGKDCSKNTMCEIHGKEFCGNAECYFDESKQEVDCICEYGEIFDFLSKRCREDHCVWIPCKNGGTCMNRADTYTCLCNFPYSGNHCSENIWCHVHGGSVCGEAICDYNEISQKVSCLCPSNKEFDKKLKICKDDCNPDPCEHGTCVQNGINGFSCKCFSGYGGVTCNEKRTATDPCSPNPCKSGGSCFTSGSGFKCFCNILYAGDTCEHGSKIRLTIMIALLGIAAFGLVCAGVCIFKKNRKLKKMSESIETHQVPETVMYPENFG